MNFLAHTLLSGDNTDVQVGNLLGEFVKGRLENYHPDGMSAAMLAGVRLHRLIDSFTDQHPVTRRSKNRLVPQYGLFSGIIVDMFYDYVLAREWNSFHDVPLGPYAQAFYRALRARRWVLPVSMHRTVDSMTSRDWFSSYATIEGIEWALTGIARRLPAASGMERSVELLETDYEHFRDDFYEFWPELEQMCQSFLSSSSY